MASTRRRVLKGIAATMAGAALFAGGYGIASLGETVAGARRRIAQRGLVVDTRAGDLEYAISGRGAPFLMIHGTGGGFDQGLRFGMGLSGAGFQIVAPSRFGYLGSSFPDDPSPERQADALVDLIDHLGIERLAVAGGSAGARPAAEFALRHPDRCSHLILLVPAMNLENRDPVEFSALQQVAVGRLLSSDAWFWAALTLAPEFLIGTLLATDPALLSVVDARERTRAHLILNELMPVSARTRGMMNDGRMAGAATDIDLGAIRAPTLVISAEDDRFGTAETARTIAARMPGARLVVYPTGGHIWLGHDADVTREIASFVSGTGAG